jgi:Holliday junction resolvase RusA-like endonuclease
MELEPYLVYELFMPDVPKVLQKDRLQINFKTGRTYKNQNVINLMAQINYAMRKDLDEKGIDYPQENTFYVSHVIIYKPKPQNWWPGKVCTQGDTYNFTKNLFDAMEGLLFTDDKLISDSRVERKYGDHPGYYIKIKCYKIPEKPKKERKKRNVRKNSES